MTNNLNVYLHDKKIGVLTEDENTQVSFKYEPDVKISDDSYSQRKSRMFSSDGTCYFLQ